MNRRDRITGFVDGYLACLHAFSPHQDGDSTAFIEAVRAGGAKTLLNRARKLDDIVLPELRKAVKEINRRKRAASRPSVPEKLDG